MSTTVLSVIRGPSRAPRGRAGGRPGAAAAACWCHPAKVNQVVFHLLANAIDACPAGGKRDGADPAGGGRRRGGRTGPGDGIDPAIRDKVFDPFFTTRPLGKGAGLGLSISYGIVQSHGGTIDFESSPEQGTCFRVRLPLRPPGHSSA